MEIFPHEIMAEICKNVGVCRPFSLAALRASGKTFRDFIDDNPSLKALINNTSVVYALSSEIPMSNFLEDAKIFSNDKRFTMIYDGKECAFDFNEMRCVSNHDPVEISFYSQDGKWHVSRKNFYDIVVENTSTQQKINFADRYRHEVRKQNCRPTMAQSLGVMDLKSLKLSSKNTYLSELTNDEIFVYVLSKNAQGNNECIFISADSKESAYDACAFSNDESTLAALNLELSGSKIDLWDLTTGTKINSLPIPQYIYNPNNPCELNFSPCGKFLCVTAESTIFVDVKKGEEIVHLETTAQHLPVLDVSEDAKILVLKDVNLSPNLKWGLRLNSFAYDEKNKISYHVSSNGKFMVVYAHDDKKFRIYEQSLPGTTDEPLSDMDSSVNSKWTNCTIF